MTRKLTRFTRIAVISVISVISVIAVVLATAPAMAQDQPGGPELFQPFGDLGDRPRGDGT